ncbi:aspartate kinase [Shewanella glacialipiscicola]|uniref:Aspartokinase n=1 Tax=Shewanella glacialipiscicola TaxID=614069 RepID=A0ABQ6J2P3_9GAMM|nr:aspartate kinase [Shewanella glacialipiscicola]MCL1086166.1 aspartate kinase [Shewanella glacialipiscicola]MCU7993933.1 aspartate kinase [Shewanella glacialipiscicola]MCU8025251.1 aspartate kinase [Shewanella glacialipiscicola]GIU09949.1 aspartokinase [Shewanella glacialipiscicola]GMA81197.1 aspartokinase [Shewanella glacialipiscicola]
MPQKRKLSGSKLFVKKFGGTSVGSIERIEAVAEQITKSAHSGEQQVLVLSAMAGETNRLFALAAQINPRASARELDMLVSTGEQVSIALMSMALQRRGIKAKSLTGDQVQIHTNSQFGRASIERVDTEYLQSLLDEGVVPIVAGFQGIDPHGDVTTLGRGGSDTTAVALAAALGADECQIFTDVAGVFTTDPNIDSSARRLDVIGFDVMLEMAKLGAKVLHPDSVEYAERFRVPLRVLSSFEAGQGTLIQFGDESELSMASLVQGIAVNKALATLTIEGLFTTSERYQALLGCLTRLEIDVEFISPLRIHEDSPSGRVSFMLAEAKVETLLNELEGLSESLALGPLIIERQRAKVSLVGKGLQAKIGLLAKMLEVLGNETIHAKLLTMSESKLSTVIDERDLQKAVRALHHAFELNKV